LTGAEGVGSQQPFIGCDSNGQLKDGSGVGEQRSKEDKKYY